MRPAAFALALLLESCASHPAATPPAAPSRPAASGRARAGGLVTIHLDLRGDGMVSIVELAGWCDHDCVYPVAPGTRLTLRPESGKDFFAGWDGPCGPDEECVVVATEDVHLTARFEHDRYQFAWARALSATDCIGAESLTVDRDLVLTGLLRGSAELGGHTVTSAGNNDVLVAGLDRATGDVRWARAHGGPEMNNHDLLGVRRSGELVLHVDAWGDAGLPTRTGDRDWISPVDGSIVQSIPAHHFVHFPHLLPDDCVIGVARHGLRRPSSIMRLDDRGLRLWETQLEATGKLFVWHLAVDGPEVVVVGSLKGDPQFGTQWTGTRHPNAFDDYFLARLRVSDGSIVETRWLFSAQRFDAVAGLAVRDGNLIFAVWGKDVTFLDQPLTGPGTRHLWLVATTDDLRIRWTRALRPFRGYLHEVRIDWSADPLLVTGVVDGRLQIGSRPVGQRSDGDTMFVAELAPDGRVLWAGGAQPGRDFNPPSLARDRDGDIYLAGSLAHETSFGAHEVRPATDGKPAEKSSCRSIYVAKLVRTR